MSSYILNISYSVKPSEREKFLELSRELKAHFAGELGKNYRIFEIKGKPNDFVEQFVCSTKEEYDNLEDDFTDKGEDLVNRLTDLIEGDSAVYSTMIEL